MHPITNRLFQCAWLHRGAATLLRTLAALLLTTGGLPAARAETPFLDPTQAFVLTARAAPGAQVELKWAIAEGYHLYQERVGVDSASPTTRIGPIQLPAARQQFDATQGKTVAVYQHGLQVVVPVLAHAGTAELRVRFQGCAEAGLCYPPQTLPISIDMAGMTHDAASTSSTPRPPPAQATSPSAAPRSASASDAAARALASGNVLNIAGVFLLAGLLLAFTPCVLPMVPILSSLIAGQQGPVSRGRGLLLALSYSLGMALVYAGFGVAAGLAGEGLAAALQNPWVLSAFALLLAGLALSMFGVYELQMPVAIQSWANDASNRFQGGSFVGVFVMGGISALVVGPCVAAPLAGALVYISQTHDVIIGGLALFSMAMGMSVPLLLVGVSAGSLLPRAGAWMERVKQVFGLMLLGVAIWIVSPVLAPAAHLLLWALWLLVVATVLGWFGSSHGAHPTTPAWARASGAACLALAGTLLVGAASGGQSVLQPLSHLAGPGAPQSGDSRGTPNNTHLPFERIRTAAELDAHLRQAQAAGQPVVLDFYADWCVACKEYEAFTFSDTRVRQALARARLLQIDVTANTADDKALLKRFGLFGPPGIALYAAGHLTPSATVIGYRKADDFLSDLAPLASNP